MYHSQVNEYKYEIERLTKELQDLKKKYYEQKKKEREDRKRAANEDRNNQSLVSSTTGGIKSNGGAGGPKFIGGGFNLGTGPHQTFDHFHAPSMLPNLPEFPFADVVSQAN
jgi:hypothetical protein